MSVLLPTDPAPSDATPSYLDWGGTLRPIFGGALQKLRRLGDRFALSVNMPPMLSAEAGMTWVARLIAARGEGAIMPWPQPGFDPGAPGSPQVAVAGQTGSQLLVSGFSFNYRPREGQFFSIIHGGRRYLHVVAADANAGSDGTVTLSIRPMLRVSPAAGAICEFARPMIEGLLMGDEQGWNLSTARTTGLSFGLQETR
jgi:hypothetical protein